MDVCCQRWHKEGRYYKAIIQKDMLGDWVVTTVWGARNSRLGNLKHHLFSNEETALEFLSNVKKIRKQRGYIPL